MDFRAALIDVLVPLTELSSEDINNLLTVPPDQKMGDYAFPCFKIGGKARADEIVTALEKPAFLSEVKAVGPYVNFYLDPEFLAASVLKEIFSKKENYGQGSAKEIICVEYCGPNTNKPLHLGHVRNMALGSAVCKVLSFAGNEVHPVNIVNDRGIHICQSMLAYQKWGNNEQPTKKGDHYVGEYYVKFAQELKKDPTLMEEAQTMLFQWEQKDPAIRSLWKKMNDWVLTGFAETYKKFGVVFDKEYFESELYEQGKEVAFEGLEKGIFVKNDDKAIVAPLEKAGLPDKVVLRGDGTSVYITQDMYLAESRFKDYHYDKSLYVVASEQRLHFKQLFTILKLLGRPFAEGLYHLSYGLVNLPSGRMKSREGTVVDADDLLAEISELAAREVDQRYPDLSSEEKQRRGEFIALAAIKFLMLRTDAVRDIVFNPEESLSFEGETGPYLQYTHARASSILRKVPEVVDAIDFSLLVDNSETKLLSLLTDFPKIVMQVAAEYKPHTLCRYLLDLAQGFNEFYHKCPVLGENKQLQEARLLLVFCVKQVLANGLSLLGIHAPEEM